MGLIDLGRNQWLFVGVYSILGRKVHPDRPGRFIYDTELVTGQEEFIARIVVEHNRTRQSYVWHTPKLTLPILELRRKKMTVPDFPGYNAVRISHHTLRIVTTQQIPSWFAALSNVKGIYLITDLFSGKQYVGKASGTDGIWQRWCEYARNGHGGNVNLRRLLSENGLEHMHRFQYSVLEIVDTHASEADILARESYWMAVLGTREFGLNGPS